MIIDGLFRGARACLGECVWGTFTVDGGEGGIHTKCVRVRGFMAKIVAYVQHVYFRAVLSCGS